MEEFWGNMMFTLYHVIGGIHDVYEFVRCRVCSFPAARKCCFDMQQVGSDLIGPVRSWRGGEGIFVWRGYLVIILERVRIIL